MSKKSILVQNVDKCRKSLFLVKIVVNCPRRRFFVKNIKKKSVFVQKCQFVVKNLVKCRISKFLVEIVEKIDLGSKMSKKSIFGQKRQKNDFSLTMTKKSLFGQKCQQIVKNSNFG